MNHTDRYDVVFIENTLDQKYCCFSVENFDEKVMILLFVVYLVLFATKQH